MRARATSSLLCSASSRYCSSGSSFRRLVLLIHFRGSPSLVKNRASAWSKAGSSEPVSRAAVEVAVERGAHRLNREVERVGVAGYVHGAPDPGLRALQPALAVQES